MKAGAVQDELYERKLVAVLRERSADVCLEKARRLSAGGLRVLEITWTTPGAASVVARATKERLGLVGAGSILTARQAAEALDAGAAFLVSPVLVKPVAALARRRRAVYVPGAATPTEILAAWALGCRPVKVFPCGLLGGPAYLRSLLAPLPHLELMPTGGISLGHLRAYLDAGAKVVGLGESFCGGAEAGKDPAVLTERARNAVRQISNRSLRASIPTRRA